MPNRNPASGNSAGVIASPAGAKQSGLALITLIILLLFLGSVAASLSGMVYSRLSAVSVEMDRMQAQYLAEAGLAQALYEIKVGLDVFGGGVGVIPPTALGPGYYRVEQNSKSSTLVAIGVVRGVRRVIVNKYG